MLLVIVSILFLLPFCLGVTHHANKESVLNFYETEVCDDGISGFFIDVSGVEIDRVNETTAILMGNYAFKRDIPDQFVVELIIHKETNGHYEVFVTEMICDLCKELEPKEDETTRDKIIKKLGLPEVCPIHADVYKVNDLIIDSTELPINAANEGKYMILINIYTSKDESCKEMEFLGCAAAFCAIEPLD